MFRFSLHKNKKLKNGTDFGTGFWTSLLLPTLCAALFWGPENGRCFWTRVLEACAPIYGKRHNFSFREFLCAVADLLPCQRQRQAAAYFESAPSQRRDHRRTHCTRDRVLRSSGATSAIRSGERLRCRCRHFL